LPFGGRSAEGCDADELDELDAPLFIALVGGMVGVPVVYLPFLSALEAVPTLFPGRSKLAARRCPVWS
jgi:hypothetical protein